MNGIVALAGHAGHLVRHNLPHHVRGLIVFGLLFEDSHAQVAVQALAIVEGRVELDLFRLRGVAQILDIQMAQAAQLGMHGAEHSIVGVAGVAGAAAGHQVVLKMLGRNIAGIVHVKALAEVVHHVAGEAELRALGALHVLGEAKSGGQHGQDKQSYERQDFSAADARQFNPQTDQRRQGERDRNEQDLENGWREESHLSSIQQLASSN